MKKFAKLIFVFALMFVLTPIINAKVKTIEVTIPDKLDTSETAETFDDKIELSPAELYEEFEVSIYNAGSLPATVTITTFGVPLDENYVLKINGHVIRAVYPNEEHHSKLPTGHFIKEGEKDDDGNLVEDYLIIIINYDSEGNIVIPVYTDYKFLEVPKEGFTLDTKDTLTFKVDSDFELFERVLINNKELKTTYYKAENGSTIITLSNEYLNGLKAGEYDMEVLFTDGYAKTKFSVLAAPVKEPVPKTSDNITTYFIVSIISVITLLSTVQIKKKVTI